MTYGPTPAGFVRKPLAVIQQEIDDAARLAFASFGKEVILSPQSPFGQLNGMYASLSSDLWETAEATYQSYDPDQAEGIRLRQIARIRLLEPLPSESEADFRAAITNTDRARIDLADIDRAAKNVEGVTYVQVWENPTGQTDADGVPGNSVAVAVIGGDDEAVARAIRPYVVPGVNTYGNARADITVGGYCRTVYFVRPVPVVLALRLVVSSKADRLGCPPPSASAIALAAHNALTGAGRPTNGQDITLHVLRTALAATYGNVEILDATASLGLNGALAALPYPIGFFEIADIAASRIRVDFA